jgi:predicted amidohydrolase
MSSLKVGLLQMSSGEDVSKNLQFIKKNFETLRERHRPDLVITPENSLFMRIRKTSAITGFEFGDDTFTALQRMVDEGKTRLILGSLPLKTPGSSLVRNAMVLLEPSKEPQVLYEKIHLFDVDVEGQPPVRESAVFEAGRKPAFWEFKGFKFGLSICYDLRFSELYAVYAKAEVDAILIPSAFLVPTGSAHWEILIRARAIESQCYVLAPAQGGRSSWVGEDGSEAFRETYGHSLAVDPWGKILLELDPGNGAGVVELQRDTIKRVRAQIPMKGHRRLI